VRHAAADSAPGADLGVGEDVERILDGWERFGDARVVTPLSSATSPMSTTNCGLASRTFIIGSRDWPPASTFMSTWPASWSRMVSACSSEAART
jgi:hypothetical protein